MISRTRTPRASKRQPAKARTVDVESARRVSKSDGSVVQATAKVPATTPAKLKRPTASKPRKRSTAKPADKPRDALTDKPATRPGNKSAGKPPGKASNREREGSGLPPAPPPTLLAPLIVGIGASAGGLEAFRNFFAHMPCDSEMAFVLVQHLAPQHESMLVELIARGTSLPVTEAADGERVLPRNVYVIPPDATLTIVDGCLQVSKPAPPRQHRWPIDTFFVSLAEDQGDRAVSIVLSGSGSDGARGLRAIKEHGGLTLAQAGFDHVALSGMPASAAATGWVDDVLPVEDMPARLLAHQEHLHRAQSGKDGDGMRHDVPSRLREITRVLHAASGHDFSQYKEKTLVRRIQRRMQVLRMESVADYLKALRRDEGELDRLFRELLIGVTEFFRDPPAFELLQTRVIPALLEGKTAADKVRVWVPGCATGEEAYSIAILLKEAMGPGQGHPKVQIFATDIDERAIAFARAGRFRGPLTGMSKERTTQWFEPQGEDFRVHKSIREMCVFSPHSAIKDPPFTRLDLISCRNLLIYLNSELQERLLRLFHHALLPRGFLLLGPSEGVSRGESLFAVVDKKHRLYLRRQGSSTRLSGVPGATTATLDDSRKTTAGPRTRQRSVLPATEDLVERNARRALERHSPAYVVVDASHDVLRFCGDTGRFLQPSSGTASLNLFSLLQKDLRSVVRNALHQAFSEQRAVVQSGLSLSIEGVTRALQVIVEPLFDVDGNAHLCVVAFREREMAPPLAVIEGEHSERAMEPGNVRLLEQELDALRLQLRSVIDQHDVANEELKSTNEEFQSVNEELQSSNEELETSKEEMQSINEELEVVNAELNTKNTALLRVNSDLRNLMESTQIATLFLDADSRIRGFTPAISALFHLRQSDIGRPITEVASRVPYPDLDLDVSEVTQTLVVRERVMRSESDTSAFLARIRPYRTVENVIDGVVLTFTDISEREESAQGRALLAAIVDSSRDIIIGHTREGTITSWNASAERILGYSAANAMGKSIAMLLPSGSPQLNAMLVPCLDGRATELEMIWQRRDGTQLQMAVTCSPVRDATNVVVAGSLIARDIDERARIDRALKTSEHRLARLIEQTSVGLAQVTLEGLYEMVNPQYCEIVGRPEHVLYEMRFQDVTDGDHRDGFMSEFENLIAGGPAFRFEKRYLRPDGSTVWVDTSVSLVTGLNARPQHVLIAAQDISERRRAERHIQMMMGELNHRVKNTLASVQSIALLTMTSATTPEAFQQTFLARLQALSGTHNLLAQEAWNGVELRSLVLAELAPYRHDNDTRVELECDALQLKPKAALALSMTLHELTTNAAKYGALSVPEGRVTVRCETHAREGDDWLHLEWRERGGPMVREPSRRGFGSTLIAHGLAYELDGAVSLVFDPAGVVCRIEFPLAETEA